MMLTTPDLSNVPTVDPMLSMVLPASPELEAGYLSKWRGA